MRQEDTPLFFYDSQVAPRLIWSIFRNSVLLLLAGPRQQTAGGTALSRNEQNWVACNKQASIAIAHSAVSLIPAGLVTPEI